MSERIDLPDDEGASVDESSLDVSSIHYESSDDASCVCESPARSFSLDVQLSSFDVSVLDDDPSVGEDRPIPKSSKKPNILKRIKERMWPRFNDK